MPQPTPPSLDYEHTNGSPRSLCWSAHIWNIIFILLAITFLTLTVVWLVPRFDRIFSAFKFQLPSIGWHTLRYSRWCTRGPGLLFTLLLLLIPAGATILIDATSPHPDTVDLFSRWFRRTLLLLCLLWVTAIIAGLLLPALDLLDVIRNNPPPPASTPQTTSPTPPPGNAH